MSEHLQFLIIDDDKAFASTLARSIKRRGYSVSVAHNEIDAFACSAKDLPKHVVLDLKLGETSGLRLIDKILTCSPDSKIMVLTGYSSISTTVEAIKLGAINYLCKPASVDEILEAFSKDKGKNSAAKKRGLFQKVLNPLFVRTSKLT